MRKLHHLLALVVALIWTAAHAYAEPFTIAIIPDTQQAMSGNTDHFANRLQWLVTQRQALNLNMVLHVGDLIDWDLPDHKQFEKASTELQILDRAGIPYAITLGNHDTAAVKEGGSAAPGNVNANLRVTTAYNSYFPASRFTRLQGTFEQGKMDNAWHVFAAGDRNWLVINLELWPRTKVVDWAKTVIESHPRHNVILLTHSYLNGKSTIEQTNGGYGDNSPQYVFDNLIKPYPNVKLIFSGHTGTSCYRTDTTSGSNTIYAFLQCYHDRKTNPIRLLEIDTDKGTMRSRVYCPATDETKSDGSAMTISDIKWVAAD